MAEPRTHPRVEKGLVIHFATVCCAIIFGLIQVQETLASTGTDWEGWENRQKTGYIQGVLDMWQTKRLLDRTLARDTLVEPPSGLDRLQTQLVECVLHRHLSYQDVLGMVDHYVRTVPWDRPSNMASLVIATLIPRCIAR
jgi:hypothetical protein